MSEAGFAVAGLVAVAPCERLSDVNAGRAAPGASKERVRARISRIRFTLTPDLSGLEAGYGPRSLIRIHSIGEQ